MKTTSRSLRFVFRILLATILLQSLPSWVANPATAATKINITGPNGSMMFGTNVVALPNGNLVITDPGFDGGIGENAGAVYLYNGVTGERISTLTGGSANDFIGMFGVTVLSNGNYVVDNFYWDNGAVTDAGAVTWCNGTTGCNGPVSPANSLVGSTTGDLVGSGGVTSLSNGNYVVGSPHWDNGAKADVGAVTWCNGATGCRGEVSSINSLVGDTLNDTIGSGGLRGVTALSNGNYVVSSSYWDNGGEVNAGAATWGNGTIGITGTVTASNSLVGSKSNDRIGDGGAIALSNGNYVVSSWSYNNSGVIDAGAATWGNGMTGTTGIVSVSNSLVGSSVGDQVSRGDEWTTVIPLNNGNYVVGSLFWDNGSAEDAGAATWGNGMMGITGTISAANSLVGPKPGDSIGVGGITALNNGNYVVANPYWRNGKATSAGAVTWGNGMTGIAGTVNVSNSLVGSKVNDFVGIAVTALNNGNYVVDSPYWANGGALRAGAVTWMNGSIHATGMVSASNSLVGSKAEDSVGGSGVTALSNGNYVVGSSFWDNGTVAGVGAVTWGNGSTGISGEVSSLNSLTGNKKDDRVGYGGVIALSNGHYVVDSYFWNNGGQTRAGAVTWGNGATGLVGVVSPANSLVGVTADDQVGELGKVAALSNGDYIVFSPEWNDGWTTHAGAVTWGSGISGLSGAINEENSVIGGVIDRGYTLVWSYDAFNNQLVVGRPAENLVTLFRPSTSHKIFLPLIHR
jgi:hypothetical protein